MTLFILLTALMASPSLSGSTSTTTTKEPGSIFVPCDDSHYGNRTTFMCLYNGRCIPIRYRCDGTPNCEDHSDERYCEHILCQGQEWFKCSNGECIASRWICDKQSDCSDHSDEIDCDYSRQTNVTCPPSEFQCNDGLCVPETWKCDESKDCLDGSDEAPELCNPAEKIVKVVEDEKTKETKTVVETKYMKPPCPTFSCGVDECIPNRWVCDGMKDCSDGADEGEICGRESLTSLECVATEGWFLCKDASKCLNASLVCDGHFDCDDKSDEDPETCGKVKDALCIKCSQNCLPQSAKSVTCYCNPGYKLATDNTTCLDVDECSIYGKCSQLCTNTDGSYRCSCEDGYHLISQKNCIADYGDPILIFSTKSEIRSLNLRRRDFTLTGTRVIHQSRKTPHAVGVSYDPIDDRVYWTDVERHKEMIISARMNGEDQRQVITSGLDIPEDIAVDFLARNLYFTDNGRKHIAVCHISGYHCTVLIKTGVDQPRAIALYHAKGLMFYSDWGRVPQITRAGMDGSKVTPIISSDIKWPNGVAVDITSDRVFWSDAKYDRIESAKFDGSDRQQVLERHIKHPFSIAVFEDTIYWSDWENQNIQACNKFNGKAHRYVIKENGLTPMGIHLSHPLVEKILPNPCIPKPCSHLCLLAPGAKSFTCKCPLGMVLSPDHRTCVVSSQTRSPQVIISTGSRIFILEPQKLGRSVSNEISIRGVKKIAGITYNPVNHTLFFASEGSRKIYALNLDNRRAKVVASGGFPKGVAYDYMADNLYWTDPEAGAINVKSLQSRAVKKLIKDLKNPLGLAIINRLRILIFTETRGVPSVKVATLDGKNIKRLPHLNRLVKHPNAITVDQKLAVIFIADSGQNIIIKYDFGAKKAEVFRNRLGYPTSLLVFGNNILWTEKRGTAMYWANMNSTRNLFSKSLRPLVDEQGTEEPMLRLGATQGYDSNDLHPFSAPCRQNNGGCSDLCFNGLLSEAVCQCQDGRVPVPGNSSICYNECSDGLYHCGNGECIPPRWVCDGIAECENGKDETDCPEEPECYEAFRCESTGQCVPMKWKCDGSADCDDSSDESNCPEIICDNNFKMKCRDGKKCVMKVWQCDGYADCDDGSDEEDCGFVGGVTDFEEPSSTPSLSEEDKLLREDLKEIASIDDIYIEPIEDKSDKRLALGISIPLIFLFILTCFVFFFVRWRKATSPRNRKTEVTLRFRNPTFGLPDGSSGRKSDRELHDINLQNQGDQNFNAYDNPGYETPSAANTKSSKFKAADLSDDGEFNTSVQNLTTSSGSVLGGGGGRRSKIRRTLTSPQISKPQSNLPSPLRSSQDSAFISIPPTQGEDENDDDDDDDEADHLSVSYTTRDKSFLLGK